MKQNHIENRQMERILPKEDETLVIGRNAVTELLLGRRQVECIYLCEDIKAPGQPLSRIAGLARDKGIPVKKVHQKKLDAISGGQHHQGVIAKAAAFDYATVDDILNIARGRGQPPFILIADGLEDPHNLGAIIRTAEAAGVHGIIIPKRAGVGLTSIVGRTSAGAVEHIPVARVTNLVRTMLALKDQNIWIYGTDSSGSPWDKTDLNGPIALVIGSEGSGMGRLVKESCDGILSLPMYGKINSLNASVAAGIVIYEAVRQRQGI